MSPHPRAAVPLLAALLLGAAGCGGGSSQDDPVLAAPSSRPEAGATEITVTVAGGKVSTASKRVSVPRGTPVRLTVTSDVADEVHVHGVDKRVDLTPGTPATLAFAADVPGTFEVELESAGLLLFMLQTT